ncbi:pentapeptide repeat-containing protein [uncultured Nostoc sp.]|uniref:pentapeptide repeat-containing protein n=1 Tax=uncultured Nostoc sp. TaxID=340711 RepID=UPI0035CAABC3
MISVSSVIATIVAGIGLFITYNENNERLITDRFSKSVEQLGNDKLEIRLGGIYSLERISKDSAKDYWTVMEVLTAFVREHAKVTPKTTEKQNTSSSQKIIEKTASTQTSIDLEQNIPISTDIQAVLTVIQRRKRSFGYGEDNPLDLRDTNLQGARLDSANLRGALLVDANLRGALLVDTNLQGAYLDSANLQGASLVDAKMEKAEYTDKSTSPETCGGYFKNYPCPTIFPPDFDPKAAGMVLKK